MIFPSLSQTCAINDIANSQKEGSRFVKVLEFVLQIAQLLVFNAASLEERFTVELALSFAFMNLLVKVDLLLGDSAEEALNALRFGS